MDPGARRPSCTIHCSSCTSPVQLYRQHRPDRHEHRAIIAAPGVRLSLRSHRRAQTRRRDLSPLPQHRSVLHCALPKLPNIIPYERRHTADTRAHSRTPHPQPRPPHAALRSWCWKDEASRYVGSPLSSQHCSRPRCAISAAHSSVCCQRQCQPAPKHAARPPSLTAVLRIQHGRCTHPLCRLRPVPALADRGCLRVQQSSRSPQTHRAAAPLPSTRLLCCRSPARPPANARLKHAASCPSLSLRLARCAVPRVKPTRPTPCTTSLPAPPISEP